MKAEIREIINLLNNEYDENKSKVDPKNIAIERCILILENNFSEGDNK